MSLEHMLRDERESWRLLLGEEFEMNRPQNLPTAFANPIPIMYHEEDRVIHTEGRPFCSDPTCGCREDRDNINTLNELIEMGLLTKDEAGLIMRGATI